MRSTQSFDNATRCHVALHLLKALIPEESSRVFLQNTPRVYSSARSEKASRYRAMSVPKSVTQMKGLKLAYTVHSQSESVTVSTIP